MWGLVEEFQLRQGGWGAGVLLIEGASLFAIGIGGCLSGRRMELYSAGGVNTRACRGLIQAIFNHSSKIDVPHRHKSRYLKENTDSPYLHMTMNF